MEFFTPEKLSYYFLYSMCSLDYLHMKNIYYGDLGISVKLANVEPGEEDTSTYNIIGFTPGYVHENY